MKIQKTKIFGVLGKKKNLFYYWTLKPLRGLAQLGSGSTKKTFFNFCFLISVDPENFYLRAKARNFFTLRGKVFLRRNYAQLAVILRKFLK
jgi:hypothetical protein